MDKDELAEKVNRQIANTEKAMDRFSLANYGASVLYCTALLIALMTMGTLMVQKMAAVSLGFAWVSAYAGHLYCETGRNAYSVALTISMLLAMAAGATSLAWFMMTA